MIATAASRVYESFGAARDLWTNRAPEVILSGPAGTGKAQPLNSTVWTPDGPRHMGDIRVGDAVLLPSGESCRVLDIPFRGIAPVYRITFSDGKTAECSDGHLWAVGYRDSCNRIHEAVLSVADIITDNCRARNGTRAKYWVPLTSPVEFSPQSVPIPPYTMGVLLGDGYLRPGTVSATKFVPDCYKYNTVAIRLAVLRGLMDTDGFADRTSSSFTSVSKRLAEDVRWLIESLGGCARVTTKQPACGQLAYTVWIRIDNPAEIFAIPRKRARCLSRTPRPVRRWIESIDYIGEQECQCITVDSDDGLYLTDGFVVTHNSRACLEKVHAACMKWPGCRWLMVRKTRESLTESALVTFEEKVLPEGSPIKDGPQRRMRQAYHYPNGSEVVLGGMDKPSKVMSTEYDGVYIQEAIELFENDFESLTTRLRNGVMPFQQIIGDTNPDAPHHWLKRRADRGATVMLESRHEDNPVLWDRDKGDWTPVGRIYISKLDALTGVRKPRLRYGKWVQAEGVVYDGWDRSIHLIPRFKIPDDWRRIRAIDFGHTNPFVCLWVAIDHDARVYVYREIYHTKRTIRVHADQIKALSGDEVYEFSVSDHDASERATLQENEISTINARKDVMPGIHAVQERLIVQGDGRPRLFVFADCLVERDVMLDEDKKPCGIIEEFDAYSWKKGTDGKPVKEEPEKINDHACDALRYAVMAIDKHIGIIEDPHVIEKREREKAEQEEAEFRDPNNEHWWS